MFPFAIVHFTSNRPEDTIVPITVSGNAYAITDSNGDAFARVYSTLEGAANITATFGHLDRITTVNFDSGVLLSVNISPDIITTQTGVEASLGVRIEDQYGNFVADARGITITSDSGTMEFSLNNGANWYSSVTFSKSDSL